MSDLTPEQSAHVKQLSAKMIGLKLHAGFHHVEPGPVVTGYFFATGGNTPVAKYLRHNVDFALAVGASEVLVQREGTFIVIYVPNKQRTIVDYKNYLSWYLHDETTQKMKIPIPLGLNSKGNMSAFDLTEAPHVLIAGSTGSGKSVYKSAIICSLAYNFAPERMVLHLVDTKKVDFPLFSSLPCIQNVVTEVLDFHVLMQQLDTEIDRRLKVLQGSSCRNIQDYHAMGLQLPYIVIIMDEVADLIMRDAALRESGAFDGFPSVAESIRKIAQIGRAPGVHLIIGTQRPSVKVIKGDIKTNLPTRIALRLPTAADSITVLGSGGAEYLLGQGDMLVQLSNESNLQRFHGPFVSLNDITQMVGDFEMLYGRI